jgi:hypothetical protein
MQWLLQTGQEGQHHPQGLVRKHYLGIQRGIVLQGVIIFVPQNEFLARYIGERDPCDSTAVLKLLSHNFKGLGKVLEGGLGIAIGLVLEGQFHLMLLAKCNNVLLGHHFKVNAAKHAHLVLHSKYCQFEMFLCKVGDGMATCSPAGQCIRLSHNGAEGVNPLVVE